MKDMNRVIIVGNGFDLAHNLKTKYEDFIKWYWLKILKNLQRCITYTFENELCLIKLGYSGHCICDLFQRPLLPSEISSYILSLKSRYDVVKEVNVSPLLKCISQSIETKGWIDIEADYYAMLVECKGKKDELERLNKDFAVIQGLLVEYLTEIEDKEISKKMLVKKVREKMLSPFSAKEISIESKDKWFAFLESRFKGDDFINRIKSYVSSNVTRKVSKVREFLSAYREQIRYLGIESVVDILPDMLYPDRIMLLNFNYTKTADLYLPKSSGFICNHIHGNLSIPKTVIFGYGDESDDEYKRLQKINDNEYLRHIKTNRYLETPNYRDLLSFIDSAPFQVCIMGHSCGLSDRTLLNTLFEHKNCVSIKPYYYINEQGKDNYLDIVQNISRNFTNPQLMRDRVVNKTYCEELPQVTRKQKEEE